MFWSLVLMAVMAGVVCYRWQMRRLYQIHRELPISAKSYPILGHTYLMSNSDADKEVWFKSLGNLAIQHGGVTSAWLVNKLYILVADPDVSEVVLKQSMEKGYVTQFIRTVIGNGSIFASVDIWRPRRKILAPVFSMKNLNQFVEVFNRQSMIMANMLEPMAGGADFSVWRYINTYTFDSVCETTLGIYLNSQSNPEHSFLVAFDWVTQHLANRMTSPWLYPDFVYQRLPMYEKFVYHRQNIHNFVDETTLGIYLNSQSNPEHSFLVAFDWVTQHLANRMTSPWLYPDFVYQRLPMYEKFVYHRQNIHNFVDEIIQMKRKELEVIQQGGRKTISATTFLDMMLESSGRLELKYSDVELREELMVIVMAGTDTSAVGASFAAAMLARHVNVQQKLHHELDMIFGDSRRDLTVEDLPKLKYTEAVVKETLRLYPPVPLTAREVTDDVTLPSGTTLVNGVTVILNIWATHRNPKFWGADAEQFRPERFLEGPLKHPSQFQPFSLPMRNCLGYNYAMMSMKTMLANMLRRYRILPPSHLDEHKLQEPLKVSYDIMMRDMDNYQIRLEYRTKNPISEGRRN